MLHNLTITRDSLDVYFLDLARAYRRMAKRNAIPLEVVLIGGASILINYGFRESTTDVDALFPAAQVFKDAIKSVGEKYNLEPHWLNSDFTKTSSYSDKLIEFSQFHKEYLGLLQIRTIKSQHLIAMKLMAGRRYKHDLTDVIGILSECKTQRILIDLPMIEQAVIDLYGRIDKVSSESWSFLKTIIENGDFESMYQEYKRSEAQARADLLMTKEAPTTYQAEDNLEQLFDLIDKKKTSVIP